MAFLPRGAVFSLFLLFLVCILSGCGYHRAGRTAELPEWIQTIYIAPWDNRSNELLLGPWVTAELRHEFLRGRALKLVPEQEADVILRGNIVQVDTGGLSYTRYDQTVERRISMRCSITLEDRRTGRVLWTTRDIRREEAFWVRTEVMQTEGEKNLALRKLSRDVAEDVYHRVTGVF